MGESEQATREIIGLLVFISVFVTGISLRALGKIGSGFAGTLCIIAIVAGLSVVNCDVVKIKWGVLEIQTIKNELKDLKVTNIGLKKNYEIFMLVNQSQWTSDGGNKAKYNKLQEEMRTSIDSYKSDLKWFIDQIKLSYVPTEAFVNGIPLCKANVGCREFEDEHSPTVDSIYSEFVNEALWVSRAKAAYLLRFTTNEKIEKTNEKGSKIDWSMIISALVNSMVSSKEHLVVSKTALDTFRYLVPDFQTISHIPTQDNSETVFDFDKAKEYWEKNGQGIIEQLNKTK